MKEIITGSKTIYDGKILKLRVDDVIANGHNSIREIVEKKSCAVGVVPVLNNGQIVMVRQHRLAADEELLEIPAGLIDEGEDPLCCGKRELSEETGYRAEKWTKLAEFYTSAGFCDEYVHLYLAQDLTPGETDPDDTESIEVLTYQMEDLCEMIKTGEVHDGKTVAGIALAKLMLEGAF